RRQEAQERHHDDDQIRDPVSARHFSSERTRSASSITLEPSEHVRGITVRWEDRIEGVLDAAVAGDQREALVELHAGHLEGRQVERCCQLELRIAEDRVRKVDPLRELVLMLQALRRQAMYARAEALDFRAEIAEGTR